MLKEVEVYNEIHRAAIILPSVQTPSQIKKFYEPVMDMEGVVVAGQSKPKENSILFELPDFSKTEKSLELKLVVLPMNSCRELI